MSFRKRPVVARTLAMAHVALPACVIWYHGWRPIGWPGGCLLAWGTSIWAIAAWRLGRDHLNISPDQLTSAQLVTEFPFSCVRHPMYLGLWLALFGLVWNAPMWQTVVPWAALLAVLYGKTRLEEALLVEAFPEYRDYQDRVKRLIPLIW